MPPQNDDQNEIREICKYCDANPYEDKEIKKEKISPIYIIGISAVILAAGFYFNFFTDQELSAGILFLAVAVISGYEIFVHGIRSLLKGKFSISFLITIAAIGAFLIGEGAEGASVIFLFFIAEYLEDKSISRAKRSMEALIKLTPDTAIVRRGHKDIKLHAHAVEENEIIIVKPGEKVPLDGIVVKGSSSINQAAITGESIPTTKKKGDMVFAGTINEEGYLEVKVTKKSNKTVLSKIIKLIKESQQKKSKTEVFIDRFSNYYTPAVMGLALIVATVPPFVYGSNFDEWFYRALTLLVISCPCALAISTPVSIVSGITVATNNGVLIKGGKYIEEMQNIKTMVFDKTGTLTEGKLEVTDVISLNNYSEKEILQITGSLESKSKHPLAEALINYIGNSEMDFKEVKNFESITGKGLKGIINGKMFYIGNKSLFRYSYNLPDELVQRLQSEGKTVVIVGNDEHFIGLIAFMDKIRPWSKSTIQKLKEKNIKTIMLTGDNEVTARLVSSRIGIDKYYAGLLPEDKLKIIDELLEKDKYVAMVGDGVNDAPALARSNVGIAMGTAGSDIAIETADVALMHEDISKVNYLINLSRKTISVVRQNVSVSILVKGSFALGAVTGWVSLWMAVAIGDMGLTLVVILNALRIRRAE